MLFKYLIEFKIFLLTSNERKIERNRKKITQSEICSGIPLFIVQIPFNKDVFLTYHSEQ